MGFDDGRIVFDRENGVYNAGEVVRGKVVFDQQKNKTFRGMYAKLKGYCDVRWTTHHSRRVNDRTENYTVEHTSHESYIENKVYLIGGQDGEVQILPGHYEYPFEFLIPPHCPPSFEGSNGHIRYELKVVIDRSFKFDQEKKVQFTVINLKDLNRDPYCKEPMLFEFEESYCCWCMSQGNCEITAKTPQSGYCPGQTVNVEVSCANNSNVTMDTIKFEIIETRKYIASHNPDTRQEENVIAKLKKGPIPGNTTRNWTLEIEIPQKDVYNLDACQYIDIRYDFKIVVSPSGCHSDTEDQRRLVLGHIPLREFEGPAQGDQIMVQPVAPSMTQYPGAVPYPGPNQYPGINPPYPGANPPYPGEKPPYPGENLPFPGANPPYPGANPPYPWANPPYPGANSSFPGANPPYPGANPPYPGANSFPSPMPGVSPYPVGDNPTPVQPGFKINSSMPSVSPYPNNGPAVSPYAASAPPPGTPDFEKTKSKWRNNVFMRNLKLERSGSMKFQFRCFYIKDVKLKEPLKKITSSLAAGKIPKISDCTHFKIYKQQSNRILIVSPRSASDNVFHRSEITTPLSPAPMVPNIPFASSESIPFSKSILLNSASPPPYTETASPYSENFVCNKSTKDIDEPLSVLDFLARKAKTENSDGVESSSKDMFLLSLLPELNAMDSKQLREFKRRVMDLIEDIVENAPSTSTPNDNPQSQIHFSPETSIQESVNDFDVETVKSVIE